MNFLSKDNPDRWQHLGWWLCVVTLPWPSVINSACIIFLAITVVADKQFSSRLSRIKSERWAWPFILYYVLVLLGVTYSADSANALSALEKKIGFVILPLAAVLGKELNQPTISFLKHSFVYSCAVIVLLSFGVAIINFSLGGPVSNFDFRSTDNYNALHPGASTYWMYFSYIQLLKWADFHPAYFSMYLVLSLVILFTEKIDSPKQIVFHGFLRITFSIFIALLSSRMAIVALICSSLYLGAKKILTQRTWQVYPILSSIAVVCFLVWYDPVSRFRVVEEPIQSEYKVDTSVTRWNSVTYRLLEWKGSWSVIQANPLLGVGTNGWQSAMTNFYNNYNSSTIGLIYNPHNQFLQIWMENGIPALITFLFCVFGSLFRPNIDQSYVAFILIFSLMCLTESIVERQKGIVFFTLFQSLSLAFENKYK